MAVESSKQEPALLCHKEPARASKARNTPHWVLPYAGSLWHKGAYNRTKPRHSSTYESGEQCSMSCLISSTVAQGRSGRVKPPGWFNANTEVRIQINLSLVFVEEDKCQVHQ